MSDGLRALLEELEVRLRAFGAPISESFEAGRSVDEIRSALAAEDLNAPSELLTWWAWHDGVGVPSPRDGFGVLEVPDNYFFDTFHLAGLEDALRTRRWWRRLYDEDLGWPDGFPPGWIPLLTSGRLTLTYFADALAEAEVVPVYLYDHGGGTPHPFQPQFESLADLVRLIVRLFDTGAVVLDPFDRRYRLPTLEFPPISDEARRLTTW